jgi:hypothetical protein
MRYFLAPVRMSQVRSVSDAVKKRGTLYTVGRVVSWKSHYGKQYVGCSENLK